ncbi:MAG TPA: hypothetical protein VIV14_04620 [Gammaproteobacteria bacterium]
MPPFRVVVTVLLTDFCVGGAAQVTFDQPNQRISRERLFETRIFCHSTAYHGPQEIMAEPPFVANPEGAMGMGS